MARRRKDIRVHVLDTCNVLDAYQVESSTSILRIDTPARHSSWIHDSDRTQLAILCEERPSIIKILSETL